MKDEPCHDATCPLHNTFYVYINGHHIMFIDESQDGLEIHMMSSTYRMSQDGAGTANEGSMKVGSGGWKPMQLPIRKQLQWLLERGGQCNGPLT